ncbi:cysteine dioxygenase [Amycolatopsis suaedae]|uniref:Cupin domain-containing protein n=1 Tax=Amycolatopsis suaedae TaxID=2510978 RepID=A0A4V2EMD4_9PSEU|nr:cysteine dioxygenase family protein [Amycolatopsis suaedae]RZQ64675.1 cupin domain-containing protein [Amycolatopsis suaedae]
MFAVPDNTLLAPENPALRHPVRVALEVATDRDRWRHLLRYDPDQRFFTLVERDEHQEIWLMGWLPGQQTDLHDHGHSTGAFTIVSGSLTETVTRRTASGRVITEVHPLSPGQSRVFGPGYVHQVRNEGPDPAVSVHVYRSGGRTMRSYLPDPVSGPVRVG